jgi:hypothetical protein
LNKVEVDRTSRVRVTFANLRLNSSGKGDFLYFIDIEARRFGDQIELDILVVHTVNYEY